jgi:hypothetical protein
MTVNKLQLEYFVTFLLSYVLSHRKAYNLILLYSILVMRMQKTLFDFIENDDDSNEIQKSWN